MNNSIDNNESIEKTVKPRKSKKIVEKIEEVIIEPVEIVKRKKEKKIKLITPPPSESEESESEESESETSESESSEEEKVIVKPKKIMTDKQKQNLLRAREVRSINIAARKMEKTKDNKLRDKLIKKQVKDEAKIMLDKQMRQSKLRVAKEMQDREMQKLKEKYNYQSGEDDENSDVEINQPTNIEVQQPSQPQYNEKQIRLMNIIQKYGFKKNLIV